MNTLFIRLEGPLQSWGLRARWGERDTALEPTKSGVIGLLACSLGWGHDHDADIRALSTQLLFGVRVDRPGRLLTDYHTVHGGVLSAQGKVKITAKSGLPETVESHRVYLADASFLAAVQGPDGLIRQLSASLQSPRWPIFLGRLSCPPALPPFAGTGDFPTLAAALASQPGPRATSSTVRALVEVNVGEGAPRMDTTVSLSNRVYTTRHARDVTIHLPSIDVGSKGEQM